MRKAILLFIALTMMVIGCASVEVKAPKDPIKVDISMRLDVYQHVEKDIDSIEDMVSGGGKAVGPTSLLRSFVKEAYAEEGLGPDVEQAAANRKARRPKLSSLESMGVIGEDKRGMVQVRSENADSMAHNLVNEENNDRAIIYRGIAKKNGTSVADVEKLYAKRLQKDAMSGTPIETEKGWQVK